MAPVSAVSGPACGRRCVVAVRRASIRQLSPRKVTRLEVRVRSSSCRVGIAFAATVRTDRGTGHRPSGDPYLVFGTTPRDVTSHYHVRTPLLATRNSLFGLPAAASASPSSAAAAGYLSSHSRRILVLRFFRLVEGRPPFRSASATATPASSPLRRRVKSSETDDRRSQLASSFLAGVASPSLFTLVKRSVFLYNRRKTASRKNKPEFIFSVFFFCGEPKF